MNQMDQCEDETRPLDFKRGDMISRRSWPDGDFVFKLVPSEVGIEYVSNMSSLPESVKKEFLRRNNNDLSLNCLKYSNQLCKVNSENELCTYIPSAEDLLAKDWFTM